MKRRVTSVFEVPLPKGAKVIDMVTYKDEYVIILVDVPKEGTRTYLMDKECKVIRVNV